uniref:(northern house mosquito) hypothetical protein n=1 Tax=Culex pipiens TaxID=7175 RepID=A0A8D8E1T6_CULPI
MYRFSQYGIDSSLIMWLKRTVSPLCTRHNLAQPGTVTCTCAPKAPFTLVQCTRAPKNSRKYFSHNDGKKEAKATVRLAMTLRSVTHPVSHWSFKKGRSCTCFLSHNRLEQQHRCNWKITPYK